MKSKLFSQIIGILIVLALFVLASYFAQDYLQQFQPLLQQYSIIGLFIFFLIITLSVILAPVTVLPLIPIASNIWGWPIAGSVYLIGWTAGSIFGFYVSRIYGQPVISKFISLEKIKLFEKNISGKHTFLGLFGLRLVIPFDLLNYAFGLFTSVKGWIYLTANFLAEIPHAYVIAYLGSLPFIYQIIAIGIGIFIILVIGIYLYLKGNLNFLKEFFNAM